MIDLTKIFILFSLCFTPFVTSANIITLSAGDSEYVVKASNGYEWLSWEETVGLSINQALKKYEADGWGLASSEDMFGLLSGLFGFSSIAIDDDTKNIRYDITKDQFYMFYSFFGHTFGDLTSPLSQAWFGEGDSSERYFRRVFVRFIDTPTNPEDSYVTLGAENYFYTPSSINTALGVALVRKPSSPQYVSEPSTLFLLVIFLTLLLALKNIGGIVKNDVWNLNFIKN